MLETIKFTKFTAFEDLTVALSPGINIFIGENGTGKTHILKAAYAACEIVIGKDFEEKINDVFYPSRKQIGRLVKMIARHQSRSFGGGKEVSKRRNWNLADINLR